MSIEKSLSNLLQQRVAEFAEGARPAEIIDQYTEQMFEAVIKDEFMRHGAVRKAVEEAVKQALPGNISQAFELTRYSNLIEQAFVKTWQAGSMSSELVARAQATMTEVMNEFAMPEVVSLNSLLESFVECHSEEAMESGWETPNIQFDMDSDERFVRVYFDKEPKDDSISSRRSYRTNGRSDLYSMPNNMAIIFDRELDDEGRKVGDVYAGKIDGDVIGRTHSSHYNDYEKLVVGLYYGKAKLHVDCDESDFCYPGHD